MLNPKYIEQFLESKIKKNQHIAVGTSKTAFKVIRELALKEVIKDLNITIIPTSTDIAEMALEYNLKLAKDLRKIDLVIEFATKVDQFNNYTKSYSQSLIRDKVIAYHADEVFVFVNKKDITTKIDTISLEFHLVKDYNKDFCVESNSFQ